MKLWAYSIRGPLKWQFEGENAVTIKGIILLTGTLARDYQGPDSHTCRVESKLGRMLKSSLATLNQWYQLSPSSVCKPLCSSSVLSDSGPVKRFSRMTIRCLREFALSRLEPGCGVDF